jgi:hypothetical protein
LPRPHGCCNGRRFSKHLVSCTSLTGSLDVQLNAVGHWVVRATASAMSCLWNASTVPGGKRSFIESPKSIHRFRIVLVQTLQLGEILDVIHCTLSYGDWLVGFFWTVDLSEEEARDLLHSELCVLRVTDVERQKKISRTLKSEEEVQNARSQGLVDIVKTNAVVNCPVIFPHMVDSCLQRKSLGTRRITTTPAD